MNKENIKKCIENFQVSIINIFEGQFQEKKQAAHIDENDTMDADTHSHQSQAQSEEQLINDQLQNANAALEHLKSIPVIETNVVQEGALIQTRDLILYVGITTEQFTEDGQDIIGISTEAPIYKKLENQTVGFKFEFAGTQCEILSIK